MYYLLYVCGLLFLECLHFNIKTWYYIIPIIAIGGAKIISSMFDYVTNKI